METRKNIGWIKLFTRKFLNWGWYTDTPVKCVFLHCLLRADHPDTTYKGVPVKRGQFATTIPTLSKELGLSEQTVRTALSKLTSDHSINRQSTNRFTLITVENWGKYQGGDSDTNRQLTDNQQATAQSTNRQSTDHQNKNNKNTKNTKNNKLYITPALGEFENVLFTVDELEKLKERFPYDWVDRIERLSAYMQSTGKRYKSHYATVLNWARKDEKDERNRPNGRLENVSKPPDGAGEEDPPWIIQG